MSPIVYAFIVAICFMGALAIILSLYTIWITKQCEELYATNRAQNELIQQQNGLIDELRKEMK